MFYLKNDDMEELFRKAAENYELDASKASDWEGIHKKLHENEDAAAGQEKKKKRRFIFWWFLLFPAGWMAHNTWDKIGKGSFKEKPVILQQQVVETKKPLREKSEQAVNEPVQPGDKNPTRAGDNGNKVPADRKDFESQPGETITGDEQLAAGAIVKEKVEPGKRPANPIGQPGRSHKNKVQANEGGVLFITEQQHATDQRLNNRRTIPDRKAFDKADDNARIAKKDDNKTTPSVAEINNALVALPQRVNEDGFELPALSAIKYIPTGMVTKYNQAEKPVDSLMKAKVESASTPKDRYFYAQVIAAPDLTSVKFQRISGAGSSIGLLLGYRFNKRLYVEAGGYWEKKVYYTKGTYFDKSKLDYFNNHEIYAVEGDCHMITIPVSLRYNFISKKNSDWFVTGGTAAYLMQKEYYDITYEYYGDMRTKGYTYKDVPKSWLATVNVGVGYQTSLWRTFNFRVEPYFRIPVSGVGTGSLSLTSAGIYIGIGRKF